MPGLWILASDDRYHPKAVYVLHGQGFISQGHLQHPGGSATYGGALAEGEKSTIASV